MNVPSICKEYNDNEVSAKNKWQNKYVLVTGKIERISNSFLPSEVTDDLLQNNKETTLLLDLGTKNGKKLVQNSVIATMKSSEFDKVSNLKTKQTVTLKGKVVDIDLINMSSINGCSVQLSDSVIK